MGGRPLRVAHLVSRPVPYHVALYRELAARSDVDLTVFFYSDASVRGYHDDEYGRSIQWDTPLLDGYRHRFFPSGERTRIQGTWTGAPNWDLVRDVLRGSFDAIWVHGYAYLNAWLVAPAARAKGTPVLIREEQTLLHGRPWYTAAAKSAALRALFRLTWGLYIGEQNRRYFRRYGMPEERLFPARYCVDNDFFRRAAAELRPRRVELRRRFGIAADGPVVLYSGKLVPRKDPLTLIEAFARIRAERSCTLLLVGDGELGSDAEALVASKGVPNVHFAGFLNQSDIPSAYAAADVFVLPSRHSETWGLVVNEAMNFGLPVVVSDKVGCAEDLVAPGRNGFVFPAGDSEALADALRALVGYAERRAQFGERSRELVGRYSLEACADGVIAACRAAAGRARGASLPSVAG